MLRAYFSAAILAGAAVILLIIGSPAKAALAGAGFALFGAAITRGVDLARERRAASAKDDEERRRDLDETRRLGYAALMYPSDQPPDPVVLATVVNALAHHSLGVDPDVAAEHLKNLKFAEGRGWLIEQLDLITDQLNTRPRKKIAE